jgi:hypothetical protein
MSSDFTAGNTANEAAASEASAFRSRGAPGVSVWSVAAKKIGNVVNEAVLENLPTSNDGMKVSPGAPNTSKCSD